MSESVPSLHSPTTGLTEDTPAFPGCASTHSARASATFHVDSVPVSAIGVSSVPSSRSWVTPVSLPKPLATNTAAGTFSWKTFPGWGMITVTPVRMSSPAIMVAWPTRTPATSVIASSGPGGRIPVTTPAWRARGRGCWDEEIEANPRRAAARAKTRDWLMRPPWTVAAIVASRFDGR